MTTRVYADASAIVKILVEEAASDVVARIVGDPAVEVVSTDLLETELRRAAVRTGIDQALVADALDYVELYAFERADFRAAGVLAGEHLRSLDALHLQGALSLDADAMLTFDDRLAAASTAVGLDVLPGI